MTRLDRTRRDAAHYIIGLPHTVTSIVMSSDKRTGIASITGREYNAIVIGLVNKANVSSA